MFVGDFIQPIHAWADSLLWFQEAEKLRDSTAIIVNGSRNGKDKTLQQSIRLKLKLWTSSSKIEVQSHVQTTAMDLFYLLKPTSRDIFKSLLKKTSALEEKGSKLTRFQSFNTQICLILRLSWPKLYERHTIVCGWNVLLNNILAQGMKITVVVIWKRVPAISHFKI